jgi:hypothetical protein
MSLYSMKQVLLLIKVFYLKHHNHMNIKLQLIFNQQPVQSSLQHPLLVVKNQLKKHLLALVNCVNPLLKIYRHPI